MAKETKQHAELVKLAKRPIPKTSVLFFYESIY